MVEKIQLIFDIFRHIINMMAQFLENEFKIFKATLNSSFSHEGG